MGKRLIRLYKKDIEKRASDLIGTEFSIVLRDKSVFHGRLTSISSSNLVFVNSRKDKFEFDLDQIDELISSE